MNIINYSFLPDGLIQINFARNGTLWVQRDEHSGKILTRKKIDTISEVQHTGIWLGTDYHSGKPLILHNHHTVGKVHISTLEDYAMGQRIYWQYNRCTNDPLKVLQIGLNHAIAGKRYDLLSFNCQTLTNTACHNRSHSEDVAKWTRGILGGIAVLFIVTALTEG